MRTVIQRVIAGSVSVNGALVSEIGRGVVVLIAVGTADTEAEADWLADKVAHLRIFGDGAGKMNLSLVDVDGAALVVSQFTLYGNAEKGLRPSFAGAAPPARAEPLVERFAARLGSHGVLVKTGIFRADMRVSIVNDGPVTIVLERGA